MRTITIPIYILAEMVMREIQIIGGRRICNLRYADDIILLAEYDIELQELVDRLDHVSQKFSVLINVENTKVMVLDGKTVTLQFEGKTRTG